MQGKELKAVLDTVTQENLTNGTMSELWAELPDMVSGHAWVLEVVDVAWKMAEYFNDEDDISEDTAHDLGHEFADSQCEDYYSNLNKYVQELGLWAHSELDDEVEELAGEGFKSLTDLNSLYYYVAMRGLWDCVARWAYAQAEELEGASNA